jgi:PLP dependent protein
MESKIKQNLIDFYKELDFVCAKCKRNKSEIKVLFATKYLQPENFAKFVKLAVDLKISPLIVGENRVQAAIKKKELDISVSYQMVMIGPLQKNKINKAIDIFDEIHSLDSMEIVKALDMRLGQKNKTMKVFLEVNISGEKTKHGFKASQLDEILGECRALKNISVTGLMTMAPYFEEKEMARPVFAELEKLADKYDLQTSMGMSGDWQIAVEEGSDLVRIGSRIFG